MRSLNLSLLIPHRTPFFLPWLYPDLLWRIPTHEKVIYLTFDDGPVPGPTEFVLKTLKQFDASATFFCIGDNIVKHPEIFNQVVANGHAVGNHTQHHVNGWKTQTDVYINELKVCDESIGKTHLEHTTLFRPPYGKITRQQIARLKAGYRIVMWDVLSLDYDRSVKPEACLRNSIGAVRPGSIVVFHDSIKAEQNLYHALPGFLQYFSDQGFLFKTLPA